jgi:hypothetical protein
MNIHSRVVDGGIQGTRSARARRRGFSASFFLRRRRRANNTRREKSKIHDDGSRRKKKMMKRRSDKMKKITSLPPTAENFAITFDRGLKQSRKFTTISPSTQEWCE